MKSHQKNLFERICGAACFHALIFLLIISVSDAQNRSAFRYISSNVAGIKGIAVRIDLPQAARYGKKGAPIAIYVPGGFKAEGLQVRPGT